MKVCITTHAHPSFGEIPVGSLWADDSPYVVEPDHFADVADEAPAPPKPKVTRKFGQKPAPEEVVVDGDPVLE